MIRQYLSNKNESTTVAKSEIFSELDNALFFFPVKEPPHDHPDDRLGSPLKFKTN
jgi:hypothetical protein